ncbi:MAG: DNA alkylation repair protein [Nanoarchaeota archaeon]
MSLKLLRLELKKLSNPKKAKESQRYFKTGEGEYGQGDIFIGLTVPQSRQVASKFNDLQLSDIESLLNSKIHEERLIALFILVYQYQTLIGKREKLFNFYLSKRNRINNWDLVDVSADKIIGNHIHNNIEKINIIYTLAKSTDLWDRRIAIISTFHFIKNNKFEDTLKISEILLNDKHDLIHKAVGWMLREVGKRDEKVLKIFLAKHYKSMPRTMLRYSIERFPEKIRKSYLKGKIK